MECFVSVYSYLLYLCRSAQHIRLQQAKTVISTFSGTTHSTSVGKHCHKHIVWVHWHVASPQTRQYYTSNACLNTLLSLTDCAAVDFAPDVSSPASLFSHAGRSHGRHCFPDMLEGAMGPLFPWHAGRSHGGHCFPGAVVHNLATTKECLLSKVIQQRSVHSKDMRVTDLGLVKMFLILFVEPDAGCQLLSDHRHELCPDCLHFVHSDVSFTRCDHLIGDLHNSETNLKQMQTCSG